MKSHKSTGDIKGILFFEVVHVSHLLFFDDVLRCIPRRNISALKLILDSSCQSAGMIINSQKSGSLALEIFCYPINSLEEGLKYIGFSLKPNKYRKDDWSWLIQKVEARISVWTHCLLSHGGQLILLKSVLESILVYWLSIALVPKGILNCIHRLSFSYLIDGY